ncbi:MAG: PD40 domain-containing protein [Gemmatimonadota bacterium]|nr:MAG: PD40 domain-containing protein [Gemmatimonadota bacterium]
MSISVFVAAGIVLSRLLAPAADEEARLLRSPAISAEQIAFVYANDIWIVGPSGGDARRLTTFQGAETEPHFSPDGSMVAFSGQYDGNIDVYVVAVAGGEPRRLTWHPGPDLVRGWTNDGSRVVFATGRGTAPVPYAQFWTVPLSGGMPEVMPIPRVYQGKFSPDGERFVYQEIQPWETEWRNYRGGQNNPIRIIDLETLEVEKLPWEGSSDNNPVWIEDRIFFLSDRDFAMNVWSYDLAGGQLEQRTFFKEFDAKNLEAGGGTLVFEMGGYLYRMDPDGGEPQKLSVSVRGDFPWARPHWENVGDQIQAGSISPTGKRAVFEARGDIFTVPAEKGDVRNLSRNSGAAERAPAWSPDGKHISWYSDAGGEYQLVIADQYGEGRRTIKLPDPTFYYTPVWSPDSKHIAFGDADRNLWVVDVERGAAKLIDNEGFAHPYRLIYPEWSPDSKWIAYTKRLKNEYNAIFAYSLESGESTQLTDGLSDSRSPAWDKSGKYLYFLASTDYGLNVGWLDLSSLERPLTFAIYMAVLPADEPSPLLPESDDEEAEEPKEGAEEEEEDGKEEVEVRIDFAGIDQRIISLDVPARNYGSLQAGEEGTIFYTESIPNQDGLVLHRYKLEDREAKEAMSGINAFRLSSDGKKLLYAAPGDVWGIVDAGGESKPGDGKLDTGALRMKVDPQEEWRQIFREAWRYQRDYFYVENVHGLDLDWAYQTYGPWVEHVRHRADLTYILDILGGETAIGHSFTGGGDWPDVETVPVGLLGADLEVANGRYRIAKIYTGENWNPELRAPLSGPGIDARVGDYILAVDGVELTTAMNPFSVFDRTANKQTVLTLNDRPEREGAREVTVVPVASEFALRSRDWVEGNRRKVDELSNGQLAYVWLPNTGGSGYTYFNRYYFAQKNKKGAVVDERWNGGGFIADYVVDLMSRELLGYFNNPVGDKQPWTAPNAAIWGPKVMIINDAAGSGGDMLPYMFRLKGIGPLVGTRTWGGLVGIWDVPPLVDGGYITAPRGGFYNLEGEWDVENIGVAPDYEVELEPKLVAEGRDPQLERAVEVALELLEVEGVKLLSQPPDPVRVKRPE